MVFDIDNLHMKGREWKVGKGRSRSLLLKDRIGRGKREGRGREEREKKGRGAACPNNKNRSHALGWPVKINLVARLKCYRRHGP